MTLFSWGIGPLPKYPRLAGGVIILIDAVFLTYAHSDVVSQT
jgi:hypothetical protein